jgi:hypothetical protein
MDTDLEHTPHIVAPVLKVLSIEARVSVVMRSLISSVEPRQPIEV